MSFTKPETVFKTLATAKPTDVFDIELVKNEQSGYWDWTNVTRASGVENQVSTSGAGTRSSVQTATNKGNWETPEERAKKQIYIIRQSSLSTAVEALSVGAKTSPKAEDIIELARKFEAFIFESNNAPAVAKQDLGFGDLEDPEDVPF